MSKNISSTILVITGVIVIPAFLFQDSLFFQILQVASFIIIAAVSGKKIKFLPPIIMLTTITLLNLFSPIGKVLFSIGRISITLGALRLGMIKAFTLIGLIYLSRATVRSDLHLPGRFGSIIAQTFYYFDQILETWSTIPKQPIIKRLDALLTKIYDGGGDRTESAQKMKTTLTGYVLAGTFILLQWVLFSLQFIVSWDLFQSV